MFNILAESQIEVKLNRIPTLLDYRVLREGTERDAMQLIGRLRGSMFPSHIAALEAVREDAQGHLHLFIHRFCQLWGARESVWWRDDATVQRVHEWLADRLYCQN